ncbi:MAG: hypothetical protein AAGC77_10110 [Pseudomonadota bacterium]
MAIKTIKSIVISFWMIVTIVAAGDIARASSVVLAALPEQAAEAKPPAPEKKTKKSQETRACSTCVAVVDKMKANTTTILPAICSELYIKSPEDQAMCEQVVNSLPLDGNNERYWLFEGCYAYEAYQSKEWVKPCPTHTQCTALKQLNNQPFCQPLPMEDPFAADE